jgi:hypothetical protein
MPVSKSDLALSFGAINSGQYASPNAVTQHKSVWWRIALFTG